MKAKKAKEVSFKIAPFTDLVIFDLETTGLSAAVEDIIQIAAIRMIDGQIREEDSFSSFVRPRQPLSDFIMSYTGISQKDVRNAPEPREVLLSFSRYCQGSTLVAHNGQSFDMRFLRSSCERYQIPTREILSIDSMHLSWKLWGRRNVRSHGLDSIVERLKIDASDVRRHDARGDVAITAKCIQEMVNRLEKRTEDVLLNINQGLLPAIEL